MIRLLITIALTMFFFCNAYAQQGVNDLITSFKILAIDSGVNGIKNFNKAVTDVTPGYRLEYTDKATPSKIIYVYHDDSMNVLKLEYKYKIEKDSTNNAHVIVTFQKVTAEANAMARIYKMLLGEDVDNRRMSTLVGPVAYANYNGTTYQYLFEYDEYRPGYFRMSFFRTGAMH